MYPVAAHQIRGNGYVVDALEAALWCFWTTDTFSAAVLAASNLGDDADTTAAICGQVAGASERPNVVLDKKRAEIGAL